MEIINAKYEIIEQGNGIEGIYKAIELPGRICYHSQDKITEGSAKPFVERLMRDNHGAPMEHGTVYLYLYSDNYTYNKHTDYIVKEFTNDYYWSDVVGFIAAKYRNNEYSHVNSIYRTDNNNSIHEVFITTNFRVLFENNWLEDIRFLSEPKPQHEKRITVKFTIDRFTGEEFLRHRKGSFNRESTRFINYTKEKNGNGSIKFILPPWLTDQKEKICIFNEDYYNNLRKDFGNNIVDTWQAIDVWLFTLKTCEWGYNTLVSKFNWQPQQARTVLPCAIDSPLIVTMFVKDWKHFFNLRAIGTTGAPHPQAKELAQPLMEEFKDKGLIE